MWTARTKPPIAGAGLGQLKLVPGSTALMAARSSVKWAARMAVAGGSRSAAVASVKIIENVAVTDRASVRVSVHAVAVPLQAPLQPLKRAVAPGAAVSVTTVPAVKLPEQVGAQPIPVGLLVTVPAADPRTITESAIGAGIAGVIAVASLE